MLAAVSLLAFTHASMAAEARRPAAEASTQATDAPHDTRTNTGVRLYEINLLSTALIEKAAAGSSPAHQFRIEARIYRELLRQLMLDNRVLPARQQIERHLLLDMVRMSALLHAAADCKTGLVIICPPDLMRRLKSQQTRIDTQLTPDLPHE